MKIQIYKKNDMFWTVYYKEKEIGDIQINEDGLRAAYGYDGIYYDDEKYEGFMGHISLNNVPDNIIQEICDKFIEKINEDENKNYEFIDKPD